MTDNEKISQQKFDQNLRSVRADANFRALSFNHPRAPKMKDDFAELVAERDFDSVEGFVYGLLWEDRAAKRRQRLDDIGSRMFPDRDPGGDRG